MLERVAGFVRRHADRRHRLAVKIVRRQKQRAFRRVVMVAQMAGHLLHRHVAQTRAVENPPRRLRARHAGIHRHLAVFAVGVMQFDLRPNAEQQTRNQKQKIQTNRMERIVNHNSNQLTAHPLFHSTKRPCANSNRLESASFRPARKFLRATAAPIGTRFSGATQISSTFSNRVRFFAPLPVTSATSSSRTPPISG